MSVDRAVARVDLDAIARNCRRLRSELREGVELCAVVKADGYGHGLLESARAALAGGATWLAVASVTEARELIDEVQARLLVLGPLRALEVEEAVFLDMEVVVWQEELVAHARRARAGHGQDRPRARQARHRDGALRRARPRARLRVWWPRQRPTPMWSSPGR